jgi:hypothetical protein
VHVVRRLAPMGHATRKIVVMLQRKRFRRDRTTRVIAVEALRLCSCSQNRRTVQPAAISKASVSRSRLMLVSILFRHQAAFLLGHVACSGHPCQKHPSTNTTTLAPMKARSARRRVPGIVQSTLKRSPLRWTAERIANSHGVSRCGVTCILRRIEGLEASGVLIGRNFVRVQGQIVCPFEL